MLTVIAFIVALSLLVVVHEFGHYWVARRCGVKVLRFSVGFGKPLWCRKLGHDGTEWVVAAIPLGGYVKMLDEREAEVAAHERHRAFNRKSVWQRFAIVLAGPAANFLAAVALYWALFVYGIPGLVPVVAAPPAGTVAAQAGFEAGETVFAVDGVRVKTWQDFRWVILQRALDRQPVTVGLKAVQGGSVERRLGFDSLASRDIEGDVLAALGLSRQRLVLPPVIGEVTRDGAAAKAGLRGGDRIVEINGERQETWDAVVQTVRAAAGQGLQFRIQRGEVDLPLLTVTPDLIEEGGARFGRIGASPRMDPGLLKGMIADVSYGPLESVSRALAKTWETAIFRFSACACSAR